MPLSVGTKAPSFTLKSKKADGLADVTFPTPGKPTVVLFFPLAFTGVCTDEMCSVSQGLDTYSGAGASRRGEYRQPLRPGSMGQGEQYRRDAGQRSQQGSHERLRRAFQRDWRRNR